jgi:hypothetical protein
MINVVILPPQKQSLPPNICERSRTGNSQAAPNLSQQTTTMPFRPSSIPQPVSPMKLHLVIKGNGDWAAKINGNRKTKTIKYYCIYYGYYQSTLERLWTAHVRTESKSLFREETFQAISQLNVQGISKKNRERIGGTGKGSSKEK